MDDTPYSETHGNSEDAPAGALVVVATGTRDASKFTGCYFLISPDSWTLYNKRGHQLASGSPSETTFLFDHDSIGGTLSQITWTITNFALTGTAGGQFEASGDWSNSDESRGPQSGSFTATSNSTAERVSTSASA